MKTNLRRRGMRFLRSFVIGAWRAIVPNVIVHRNISGVRFACSLKEHYFWLWYGCGADAERLPIPHGGAVWDLGCNIGLYSVEAALSGCKVFAFDISQVNISCLRQTALDNKLDIQAIHSPITVGSIQWSHAKSGWTEEKLTIGGSHWSIDYDAFSRANGCPAFIKMDIQGGESEFLKSPDFKAWLHDNRVSLYLETHDDSARLIWPEFKQCGPIHYFLDLNENAHDCNGEKPAVLPDDGGRAHAHRLCAR